MSLPFHLQEEKKRHQAELTHVAERRTKMREETRQMKKNAGIGDGGKIDDQVMTLEAPFCIP